jgi:hypothetical protein
MYNRSKKKNIFVCSAINNNLELISKYFEADSESDASKLFEKEFNFLPKIILGPFTKKKVLEVSQEKTINFSNPSKKAIYNQWIVNAFEIKENDKECFIIYVKPVDNIKKQKINNTCIIPTSELTYI